MNPNTHTPTAVVETRPLAVTLSPLTNEGSRRIKFTLRLRPASLFSYDALGRLFFQQEPWGEGVFKITRIHYLTDSPSENSSRIVSEFILGKNHREYFQKKDEYHYSETSELKRETLTSTAAGSDVTRRSLREWFGNANHDLCRGKLKLSVDYNGLEYHYEYTDVSGKSFPKPFQGTPDYARTTTLLVRGKIVPGLSTRSIEIYDHRDCCLCRQNHAHDGRAFIPIHVEFHPYDESRQCLRSYRGEYPESETSRENIPLQEYNYTPGGIPLMQTILGSETPFSRKHLYDTLLEERGTDPPSRFYLQEPTSSGILMQTRLHSPEGPLCEESLLNGFGEVILRRKAVAPGVMEETSLLYNEKGQLTRESTLGKPSLHFRYDPMGNLREKYTFRDTHEETAEFILESYHHAYCRGDSSPKKTKKKKQLVPPVLYYKITHSRHSAEGLTITESHMRKVSTLNMAPGESLIIHRNKYGHCSVKDTCLSPSRGELITYSYIPESPDSAYEIHREGHLVGGKYRNGIVFDSPRQLPAVHKHSASESGEKIHFEYDEASETITSLTCGKRTTQFLYNKYGKLARISYPEKSRKEYHYADFDSEILTAITFSGNTAPLLFHYDAANQLTQVQDSLGIHDFHYSPLLDLATEKSSHTNTRLSHLRDPWGRLSGHSLSQNEVLLQKSELQYDHCNRICRLEMAVHSFFLFTYDPQTGAPSGILFPNGIRLQYVHPKNKAETAAIKYRFPRFPTALEYTTSSDENTKNIPFLDENFSSEKFIPHALPKKLRTITGVWRIKHDARELPTHFRQGDLLIEFLYDYRGRRAEKSIFEAGRLVERICYTYSDTRLLCEFDHTSETPIPICSYLWHPWLPVPLAFTLSKGEIHETCYYLLDPDNNIRALVDSAAQVRAAYQYNRQGKIIEKSGDLADLNPFRERSLYHDDDLGFPLPLYFPRADEENQ